MPGAKVAFAIIGQHQGICIQRMFLLVGRYQAIWFTLGSRFVFKLRQQLLSGCTVPAGGVDKKHPFEGACCAQSAHCAKGKNLTIEHAS